MAEPAKEEAKESVISGIKQEAAEQATHAIASEIGQGIRKFLQGTLSPETIRKLGESGLVKILSNVAAFAIRLFIPDTKKGELLKDAVTEALNEAFDFEKVPGVPRSAAAAEVSSGAPSALRTVPAPRKGTQAVLRATREVVERTAAYLVEVYRAHGEKELENVLAWLNSLSQAELEAFAFLPMTHQHVFWKAQKDLKERKRLLEIAEEEKKKFVAWWQKLDAECAERIPAQEARIVELKKRRERGVPWLRRPNPLHW